MKVWNFIKNNVYIKNFLLAVIILLVLVFGVLLWLNHYTKHNEAVLVPDVKGLKVEDAAQYLERSGLRYTVIDSVHAKNVAPGAIVETIPTAGTKVKENRIIFITVMAEGSEVFSAPSVKDQSQRQAISVLKAIGFKNIDVEYVSAAFKDLVVGLKYKGREVVPGERIPANGRLVLEVSAGDMELQTDSSETESVTEEESQEESWF